MSIIGIKVEYTEIDLKTGEILDRFCVENPNSCCTVVQCEPQDRNVPITLYFTVVDPVPSGVCNCGLSTVIPMIYDPDEPNTGANTGSWVGSGPLGSCGYSISVKMWFSTGCVPQLQITSMPDGCTAFYFITTGPSDLQPANRPWLWRWRDALFTCTGCNATVSNPIDLYISE